MRLYQQKEPILCWAIRIWPVCILHIAQKKFLLYHCMFQYRGKPLLYQCGRQLVLWVQTTYLPSLSLSRQGVTFCPILINFQALAQGNMMSEYGILFFFSLLPLRGLPQWWLMGRGGGGSLFVQGLWDQLLNIPTEGYEGKFSIFGVGLTGHWRRKNKCDISKSLDLRTLQSI